MILTVKVRPNSRQTKISGWIDAGTVVIDIKSPPIDGKANIELINFLAKELGIAKSLVTIKRGQGSKVKHIELPAGTDLRPINPAV
ncbi:hypothetical protein CO057_04565 [Candidatus Uhrbacteria bacterium CG_4_9_14_0_2_um_filter_41_50]|uniref:UPF0235 protein CO057_04565 n=1 Tax=Candidatus Uhrbacteria bacterium CG_4_9_14_0_2_um_filter_41_50 TaxID=1975031 RepID=A0A2M8EN42_9BACT|nr:MAG: hypothetical protein COZ45_01815 [Candidatus Uhrbacteria bacterium CG_4_10_14_3_um_filter_41_21]PIZ55188.1 MAG: hypothetical protein COY24_01510 [Candidatus Uhrbacteria bacterium CG_4_10_14_0_2_um_filter_41_21]PJB84896.1 MAG: hypothetical protein CO086_01370 [Candidatus Uhrbacteria bacterium CG_4_9_14_0_8_um_filter_41_16]PJC24156.1 MAG: hypothetical protein CO057_04565 [Candidatus Uhrbacteria bacterium CG_4_9_14_0_2_um_filter_41_50]PJE75045.1 MAG: hypothetical protein COV03_02435 [Candi